MTILRIPSGLVLAVLLLGCPGDDGTGSGSSDDGSSSGGSTGTAAGTTTQATTSGTATSSDTSEGSSDGSSVDGSSGTEGSSGASSSGDGSSDDSGSSSDTGGQGSCGDGVRDLFEVCDDGNVDAGDWCSDDCYVITLDFDLDEAGAPIPSGTVLDDYYSTLELSFFRAGSETSCVVPEGDVFANADHGDNMWGSSPNTVSTCSPPSSSDIAEEWFGAVWVLFPALPADEACITVWTDDPAGVGFIRAYDGQEFLIDEVTSSPGVTGPICVNANDMAAVAFGGLGQSYVRLDDFRLGQE